MTARYRPTGFTLVEIMIVIAVLALAAGMAVSRFEPNVAAQLSSFADVTAADLMQARQLAIANNSSYCLTFEVTNNRYYLEYTGSNSALATLPPTIYGNSLNTATRQYFDLDDVPNLGTPPTIKSVLAMTSTPSNTTTLEFGPLGSTTQTAETVIWLTSGSGLNLLYAAIHVNPVTGLVTVDDVSGTGPPGS